MWSIFWSLSGLDQHHFYHWFGPVQLNHMQIQFLKIHQSQFSMLLASGISWGEISSNWKSLSTHHSGHKMVKTGHLWLCWHPDEMFVLLPDLYSLKEFTAATWLYAVRSVITGLASSLSNLETPAPFFTRGRRGKQPARKQHFPKKQNVSACTWLSTIDQHWRGLP